MFVYTAGIQDAQAAARAADAGAHTAMTFEALTYLAHYLSGVPGRKNLLWFASTFPVVLFPSQEESKSLEKNSAKRTNLALAKGTADLFTSAQISIYPLGAEGMMMEHVMEADTSAPASPGLLGRTATGADVNIEPYHAGANERAQLANAMEQLAASTGGKAFYNTNNLNGAMEKAIDHGANYYAIGYSPTDKTADGSFRRVDVAVTHGKYTLAYRHGYYAREQPGRDAQTKVNPLTTLLEYGLPDATGVLYGVRVTAGPAVEASPANRAGANTALQGMVARYQVDFTIRAEDVELRPSARGGRSAHILIGLKAYDRDGNAMNWEGDYETLDLQDTEYAALVKTGIPVHLVIDLPAYAQGRLVTAVYDRNSGRAGTLELPFGGDKK